MSERQPWPVSIVGHGMVDPRTLVPHPRNPKVHPAEQDAVVGASLRELGWLKSLTINRTTGHVLDGHERLALALRRGIREVPVEYVEIAAEDEGKALLTLDASAALAQPHLERWAALRAEAQTQEPALQAFWAQLAAQQGEAVPLKRMPDPGRLERVTQAGELQAQWGTAAGQVWQCGPHRVACGDSTDAAVVAALLETERVPLVVTSPPYWVERTYEGEYDAGQVQAHMQRQAGVLAGVLEERCQVALNTGTTTSTHHGAAVREIWLLLDWWQAAFQPHGLYVRNLRIWAKEGGFASFTPAQDLVGRQWEFLASLTRQQPRPQRRVGERWALDGVWTCEPETVPRGHSAPFPLVIPERYISLYTDEGDLVYDPYLGSGTTLLACAKWGRRGRGCEQDPGAVAVTLERWVAGGGARPRLIR